MTRTGKITTLLILLALALASCGQKPEKTLAQLAGEAPEEPTEAAPVRAEPLAALVVVKPDRLLSRIRTILPFLEGDFAKRSMAFLEALPPAEAVCLEIEQLEPGIDLDTNLPVLKRVQAVVVVVLQSGDKPGPASARWDAFLRANWPGDAGSGQVACGPDVMGVLCTVGGAKPPAGEEAEKFSERCASRFSRESRIALHVDLPELVNALEAFVSEPLFWAVVPEEILKLEAAELVITEEPDRLEISLFGRESGLLESVAAAFSGNAVPVELPVDSPFVAFASAGNIETRLEKVEEHWAGKLPIAGYKVSTWVNDTWRTQLLNLVSGIVGATLVGDIVISSPLEGLVYMLQPTDQKLMEKRLRHIFTTKHYKLESVTLPTGEELTKARRKRGRKVGKERLAWFHKNGTCFVAASAELLEKLAAGLSGPKSKDGSFSVIRLPEGMKAGVRFSVKGVLQRLKLPKSAGLSERLAFGMFLKAIEELEQEVTVALLEEPGPGNGLRLAVRVDNVQQAFDTLLEKVKPLLKFVPTPAS